jgi:SAM-dependent methyltransferase
MDYQDARIAEIYDVANPLGQDGEFYLSLAGEQPLRILDLGCGTGVLCCALVERGHEVTGVDPAGAMLALARRKPYADRVEWVEATAQRYRSEKKFGLIVMTGHAFQCLLTDEDVLAVFGTMGRHLAEGGRVAFETRNPRVDWAGEWAARAPAVHMVNGERVVETPEVTSKEGEFVSFTTHFQFANERVSTRSRLRFPSREHVKELMGRAALRLSEVFGDWDGGVFEAGRSREMIFVAEITKVKRPPQAKDA